jgi:hypothetical protein
MFVTAQGSPYARFRRALATGDLALIQASASELPRVGLDDALQVCLLLRDAGSDLYERAVVRWLGRFCLEARGVALDDVRIAATAFSELPGAPELAMERLAGVCHRYALDRG